MAICIHASRIHLSRSEQTSHIVRRCVLLSILNWNKINNNLENLLIHRVFVAESLFLIKLKRKILFE